MKPIYYRTIFDVLNFYANQGINIRKGCTVKDVISFIDNWCQAGWDVFTDDDDVPSNNIIFGALLHFSNYDILSTFTNFITNEGVIRNNLYSHLHTTRLLTVVPESFFSYEIIIPSSRETKKVNGHNFTFFINYIDYLTQLCTFYRKDDRFDHYKKFSDFLSSVHFFNIG